MKHFISVEDVSEEDLFSILQTAEAYRKHEFAINQKLFAANLFYEPSTRTKMSFTVAEKKLGMDVLDFHTETSSTQKGESLYDTVKTFEAIGANVVVIRHEADNWFRALENKMSIPVINAGAGQSGHPTQCLLDLLTIYQEFGDFENLKVLIAGDINHSRVARSNAFALKKLGAEVYLSAAPGFEDEEMDFPYISMDEGTHTCDVVMLLRIQHERHQRQTEMSNYLEHFGYGRKI